MEDLPQDKNFLNEDFLANCQKAPLSFERDTLDKMAAYFQEKEKNNVSKFIEEIKSQVVPGLTLEELVRQVVRSALGAEFGSGFLNLPANNRIISAIEKVINEDPELLERVVAVALKAYIEKNKNLN
jgi:lipoate-protein ligase A